MAGYLGSKAVLLSTTAAVVTGDMTVDTNTLYVDSTNNRVGVGNTTPTTALDVTGDIAAVNGTFTGDVTIGDDLYLTGPTPLIYLTDNGVADEWSQITNSSGNTFYISRNGASNGQHIFQQNAGGVTTEAMRINISGRVGIGTTTPSAALEVKSASAKIRITDTDLAGTTGIEFVDSAGTVDAEIEVGNSAQYFAVKTGGLEAMRIDSSGNVGIGTSSLTDKFTIDTGQMRMTDAYGIRWGDASVGIYGNSSAETMTFTTVSTERMRIDSSGNLLVGRSSPSTATSDDGWVFTSNGYAVSAKNGTGDQAHVFFQNNAGVTVATVGSINTSASSTSYNTSSDYRLKENVTPIQGAADIVMSMRPCTYNFKADVTDWHDGFLAHELQEVHPRAVSGAKDAMKDEEHEITPAVYEDVVTPAVEAVAATYDDEGIELTPAVEATPETTESVLVTEAVMGTRSVPDYQGVDYAKLTPILTAALQEALTEIAALKVRVAALEVTP